MGIAGISSVMTEWNESPRMRSVLHQRFDPVARFAWYSVGVLGAFMYMTIIKPDMVVEWCSSMLAVQVT